MNALVKYMTDEKTAHCFTWKTKCWMFTWKTFNIFSSVQTIKGDHYAYILWAGMSLDLLTESHSTPVSKCSWPCSSLHALPRVTNNLDFWPFPMEQITQYSPYTWVSIGIHKAYIREVINLHFGINQRGGRTCFYRPRVTSQMNCFSFVILLTYSLICYVLDNFLSGVGLNVQLWETMSLNNTIVF